MFHFTANLKPYTFLERPEAERFDAYLLSADYVSGLATMAADVREQGRQLVADNGNVDLLRGFIRNFKEEAAPLDTARKAHEKELGRYARPGELPRELSGAFAKLAVKIAEAGQARITDAYTREAIETQTSIDPSFLIGMEDLTLGTLTALNIEPEYAVLPRSFYEERAERAVTFARRTQEGAFGPVSGQVLAGLHAIDFDSALLAGRLAADAGLEGVAVGLFGALTDHSYIDFRMENGQVIELQRNVPRPYLRVIEICAGIMEGYRQAGRPRPAFHALGVGTPILLPLLSLLSEGDPYFATDSTAPIVDGWSSPTISLYVDEPAPLKYKAYKIADHWIRGGRGWDCECRDCTLFHRAHPPDIDGARRWWKGEGEPKITKLLLERNGPLSPFLPFLAYSADDDLRREAGLARVGHNHWLLRKLEREIRDRSVKPSELHAWVEGIVSAYAEASSSKAWATAVREAFSVAQKISRAGVDR